MKSLLLGAAVLAFAACGSDDPNDPNDPNDPTDPTPDDPDDPDDPMPDDAARDYDDVANVLGASTLSGEVAAMVDMVVIAYGGTPSGFTMTQGDGFSIAEGTRGGITFSYNFHCNDDADAVLATCSGAANHAHIYPTIYGDVSGANMSMTAIEHDGNLSVRDLQVNQPRVGGSAEATFSASLAGDAPATYQLSYTTNFDRVRYEPAGQLPLAGQIDFLLSIQRDRGGDVRNFAISAALAFDGDTTATLVLDSTRNYSVDLTTGVVTKL